MGVGAQPMERGGSSGLVAVAAVRKDTKGCVIYDSIYSDCEKSQNVQTLYRMD